MFHIILYQPEIPPNTGNIIRLCANTGAQLHLIEPLGFSLDDARLRRAGLDYHEWVGVQVYPDWPAFLTDGPAASLYAFTTKAEYCYHQVGYRAGDSLLFGPETRGLPAGLLAQFPPERRLRIPMLPQVRSLNLSNAVAVAVYEAWRQLGFPGVFTREDI
jgi:tRNA (cytidine/uridine-2'-O-)-methyltransferase